MTVLPTTSPTGSRRDFRLGVANGAIYQGGEAFLDGGTVVPLFLSRLTSSNALIGLGSALVEIGWSMPQFLVAPAVARHRTLLWLYRRAAVIRGGALAVLTACALLVPRASAGVWLAIFFACYGAYCFGAGQAALPFMEVVSKVVPERRLASFFSQRLFWGGLLAAVVGLIVRQVLEIGSEPIRWAILFGLAALLTSIAYGLFAAIREPEGEPGVSAATPLGLLREGVTWLRERPSFRRLLIARMTLNLWLTASPFIVLFAVRELGAGARAAGTFLFARVAGYVLSNLLWQRVARRYGTVVLLRIATAACGALGFVAAALAFASPWGLGWLPAATVTLALELVLFLGGASQSGVLVATASLMLQLAPPERRRAFVSLTNAFLGPTNLLPALGGALVDVLNGPVVFALCGATALIGVRAALRLELPSAALADAPAVAVRVGTEG